MRTTAAAAPIVALPFAVSNSFGASSGRDRQRALEAAKGLPR
jgi:hypothetical protein